MREYTGTWVPAERGSTDGVNLEYWPKGFMVMRSDPDWDEWPLLTGPDRTCAECSRPVAGNIRHWVGDRPLHAECVGAAVRRDA